MDGRIAVVKKTAKRKVFIEENNCFFLSQKCCIVTDWGIDATFLVERKGVL
jgi:hypothetical protein